MNTGLPSYEDDLGGGSESYHLRRVRRRLLVVVRSASTIVFGLTTDVNHVEKYYKTKMFVQTSVLILFRQSRLIWNIYDNDIKLYEMKTVENA